MHAGQEIKCIPSRHLGPIRRSNVSAASPLLPGLRPLKALIVGPPYHFPLCCFSLSCSLLPALISPPFHLWAGLLGPAAARRKDGATTAGHESREERRGGEEWALLLWATHTLMRTQGAIVRRSCCGAL